MIIRLDTQGYKEVQGDLRRVTIHLPAMMVSSLEQSLRAIGMTAATKFMIPSTGGRGNFNAPANPTKLTWRSRRLPLSLMTQGRKKMAEGSEGGIRITSVNDGRVTGELFTRVPYAGIHEYGGTIPPRTIVPLHAKALHWKDMDGKDVFARRVKLPARQVRPRPFLTPASTDPPTIAGIGVIFNKNQVLLLKGAAFA